MWMGGGGGGGEKEVEERRGEEEKGNYLLFPSPPLPLWRTLYSSAGPGPAGISSIYSVLN